MFQEKNATEQCFEWIREVLILEKQNSECKSRGFWHNLDLVLKKPEQVLVYCDDDEPIGFVLFNDKRHTSISILYVDPEVRYNGYGTDIMKKIEGRCVNDYNMKVMQINHVIPEAIDFYKKVGYQIMHHSNHDEYTVFKNIYEVPNQYKYEVFLPINNFQNKKDHIMSIIKDFEPSKPEDCWESDSKIAYGRFRLSLYNSNGSTILSFSDASQEEHYLLCAHMTKHNLLFDKY